MKFCAVFLGLAFVATLAQSGPVAEPEITTWEQFKAAFNKKYSSSVEEQIRKENFENALKFVKENQDKLGVKIGIHENSDLSETELGMNADLMIHLLEHLNSTPAVKPESYYAALPAHFDWREQTQVNPIENQGSCGSCWAFAATFTVETQLAYRHKTHVRLSKQELVDCANHAVDSSIRNQGCQIGYPDDTYAYIQSKGLYEEQLYPYNGQAHEACYTTRLAGQHGTKYHVQNHHRLAFKVDDNSIMNVIHQYGPPVVVIHGTDPQFMHYKGGIIRNLLQNSAQVNHVVGVVGWGTEGGVDYWIIRNSWGSGWGEHGYARIERHHNNVAFNNWVSYPIMQ